MLEDNISLWLKIFIYKKDLANFVLLLDVTNLILYGI